MLKRGKETEKDSDSECEDIFHDLQECPSNEGLISTTRSRIDSFSSVSSIYSADGGKGSYGITGTIQIGVWFKNNVLFMRVVRAEGLAAAKSGGVSDPYVKTYLLPDKTKHTKRKTAIQRKTTNPEYNEILKNKLLQSDIKLCTLWLSVWDWDKFGRNQFLGEVRLPLSSMDLTDSNDHMYTLQDRHQPCEAVYRGKLKFAIKYEPSTASKNKTELLKGSLIVSVKEAKDLPQMDPNGLTDSFVKTYLLPKRCPVAKKKTSLVKGTLNPAWNEELEYKHVYLSDLRTRVLELTVWDYDRRGCNDFIGCLRLGPSPVTGSKKEWMDSTEKEAEQWEEMLAHPGEWVEYEHDLRPSIESSAKLKSRGSTRRTIHHQEAIDPVPAKLLEQLTSSMESVDSDEDPQGLKLSGRNIKGRITITGKIRISLEHKKGKLRVQIHDAQGLAAADRNGFSDPYVKIYLLPDKAKYKTDVRKKTLDPIFNAKVNYQISEAKLSSRVLWLSVWDWDRIGKDEFLGEVRVPLSPENIPIRYEWYTLQDRSSTLSSRSASIPSAQPDDGGKLRLRLQFQPLQGLDRGTMHVHIVAGEALPGTTSHNPISSYVKINLLPDGMGRSKKTSVVGNSSDPAWNEQFVFPDVTLHELTALQLAVWDYNSDNFVGGVCLRPSSTDCTGEQVGHWDRMLAQQGEWVEYCHTLQPSLDQRKLSGLDRNGSVEEASGKCSSIDEEDTPVESVDTHHAPLRRSSDVLSQRTRPVMQKSFTTDKNGTSLHPLNEEQRHCTDDSEALRGNGGLDVDSNNLSTSPLPFSSLCSSPLHPLIDPLNCAGLGVCTSTPETHMGEGCRAKLHTVMKSHTKLKETQQ